MILTLISIISISILTLYLQYPNIIHNLKLINKTNSHTYISHNIKDNSETELMYHKLTISHCKWIYLWIPITIINILLSISTIILIHFDFLNINLLYIISILTATSISPFILFKKFPWINYYNNITQYHNLKLQLILINNILTINKNKLLDNLTTNNEITHINHYSLKLIDISQKIQSDILPN